MTIQIKEISESEQRAELHKRIWAIADDLRGAVNGWDFKQYVLGTLFLSFHFRKHDQVFQ